MAINNEHEFVFIKTKIEEEVIRKSGHFGYEIWWTGGHRRDGGGWFWDDGTNGGRGMYSSLIPLPFSVLVRLFVLANINITCFIHM